MVALQIRPGVRVYFLENISVANPDLELRVGGGPFRLFFLLCFLSLLKAYDKGGVALPQIRISLLARFGLPLPLVYLGLPWFTLVYLEHVLVYLVLLLFLAQRLHIISWNRQGFDLIFQIIKAVVNSSHPLTSHDQNGLHQAIGDNKDSVRRYQFSD